MNFEDTKFVFSQKSNWELKKVILDLFNNKLIFNPDFEKYSRKNLSKNLTIILDTYLSNKYANDEF